MPSHRKNPFVAIATPGLFLPHIAKKHPFAPLADIKGLARNKTAHKSMFIKFWLDNKHSTINHYFAFVANWSDVFPIATTS